MAKRKARRRKGRRLLALAFIVLIAFGALAYGISVLFSSEEEYPVPPADMTLERLKYTFDCPGRADIMSSMELFTTPEGFFLEGGRGLQFLAQYRYPKVLVVVAFMKFDNETVARATAEKIVNYASNFTANYTKWESEMKGNRGYAKFEYPGLTWEMWYSGNWVIEVTVGESGGVGRRILSDIKGCIAESCRP